MLKNLKLFVALSFLFVFVACNKEDDTEILSVENFTETAIREMGKACQFGSGGCFELVYPIEIVFEDATTASVNDKEELKQTIKDWKEANPNATERPTFAFPLEVINEDGEVISVADKDALKELAKMCRKKGGNRKACFRLVYPISLEYPDGTVASYDDHKAMKQAVRAWKVANPTVEERPTLVFPLSVIDKDGVVTEVSSKEELTALKEACE